MRIMISAGEASGDMHAGALAAEIKKEAPQAELFGMGGASMRRAGVEIIYDIENLGIIGMFEVIRHLPLFFRLRSFLKGQMETRKPDVLVCVDYPGFNMKLAHVAKGLGIPVVYYIAPTIWAWHKSRAKNIVRDVTQVASIFPFEAKAYQEAGAPVTFVGHPLADTVKPSMSRDEAMHFFKATSERKRVLLMPGSRKNEVSGLLPIMLEAAKRIHKETEAQFFLPRAETISKEFLKPFLKQAPDLDIQVTTEKQYDLMSICHVAIASSGTATLETALMKLPTILVYRLSRVTWILAKLLVQIQYAGLPNILLGKEVTLELLQDAVNPETVSRLALSWLTDEEKRQKNICELQAVREAVGAGGAVARTARLVLNTAGAPYGNEKK